jgi:dTDP-4-dehydrorhamnose reductase
MRALILGAGGMLGHDLLATAPQDVDLFPFTRGALDITNARAVAAAVADARPNVIINAAAYTAVDQAESEPELAFRLNAEAVGELGRLAARAGARVVHFSTDFVFDGTATEPYEEDSPAHPVNAYGASKLAGETALRQSGADFLIVRTQWLFGLQGRSFPRTMWERAGAGLATRVVGDQTGRPTYTEDLAGITWALIDRAASGVLHVANHGVATWFEVAEHIFLRLGRRDLLSPCTTVDYPTAARRPRYSVLSTHRMERLLGAPLPDWRCAVDGFLQALARQDS